MDEIPNLPFGQLSRSMQKFIGYKNVRPSVLEQLGLRPDKVYAKFSWILCRYEKCLHTVDGKLFVCPSSIMMFLQKLVEQVKPDIAA